MTEDLTHFWKLSEPQSIPQITYDEASEIFQTRLGGGGEIIDGRYSGAMYFDVVEAMFGGTGEKENAEFQLFMDAADNYEGIMRDEFRIDQSVSSIEIRRLEDEQANA